MVFEPTLETEQRGSPTKPACKWSEAVTTAHDIPPYCCLRNWALAVSSKRPRSCRAAVSASQRGTCRVNAIRGASRVNAIRGASRVNAIRGASRVNAIRGASRVNVVPAVSTRCQPCQRGTCRVNAVPAVSPQYVVPAVSTRYLPCQRGTCRVLSRDRAGGGLGSQKKQDTERRETPEVPLCTPLEFTWRGQQGEPQHCFPSECALPVRACLVKARAGNR